VLKPDLTKHVISPLIPAEFADDRYDVMVNPTGRFELGGPHADAGLTGRKIIVDTYGGRPATAAAPSAGKTLQSGPLGGVRGAVGGQHVVASGAARRCEIQVAYAIGVAHPVSVMVETFGTESVDPARISSAISEVFDLRPAAIIADLDLRRPIYRKTAAYGHFGRPEKEFSWEHTTRLEDFRSAIGA